MKEALILGGNGESRLGLGRARAIVRQAKMVSAMVRSEYLSLAARSPCARIVQPSLWRRAIVRRSFSPFVCVNTSSDDM